MSWLRNNIATIMVAVTVAAFAWLYGGMRGSVLPGVMPWLSALLIEVMLFFPHQRQGETTSAARLRVWEAMRRDPLVWTSVAFLLLLAIPFLNHGLCPSCDAAAIAGGADPAPATSLLPYCVNRLHHLTVFLWFLPTLVVVIAMRHALSRDEKLNVLGILVWNGVLLAIVGFVQLLTDAPGPLWSDYGKGVNDTYFFSVFGYPNAGGDYFAALFAVSIGLWRQREESLSLRSGEPEHVQGDSLIPPLLRKHYHLIAAFVLFCAAVATLSRAAMLLVFAAAFVLFLHACRSILSRFDVVRRVKMRALLGLGLVVAVLLAVLFTPADVRRELGTVGSRDVIDRVARPEYHTRIAMELFWDHPAFGCGGWGYAHLSPTKMTEDERHSLTFAFTTGTANVHNDYLQFLCELGIVGCGCLAAIVWFLLAPVIGFWRRRARAVRFVTGDGAPPSPRAIFVFPAGAFAVLFAALVTLVHSFGDCPMRSPAVLSLFFVEIAALDGFIRSNAGIESPEVTNVSVRHHHHRHHHHHHHHHSENA